MEIIEFRDLAAKANPLGKRLEKINVGIDAWSYPLGSEVRPLPLVNPLRYTVRYYYGASQNEATQCASGSGFTPQAAIVAAYAQFVEREFTPVTNPPAPAMQMQKA